MRPIIKLAELTTQTLTRRQALRFGGQVSLCGWLPATDVPLHPSKRRLHNQPAIEQVSQRTAKLMAEMFPSTVTLEFRDQIGFDGQNMPVEDGEKAELGSYYTAFALFDGDGELWGDIANMEANYLRPSAMAMVRTAMRTPEDDPVLFLRPPTEYLPVHTLHTHTAVYNGVCVRATEFLQDELGVCIKLDIISGVKGQPARQNET